MFLILVHSLPVSASMETRVQQYTAKLPKEYGFFSGAESQPVNILFIHVNRLLKQSGTLQPSRSSLHQTPFSLQISMEKEQLVTTTTLYKTPTMRLRKRTSFAVPGLNPALRQQCDRLDQRCWVLHPASNQPWLELRFNPALSQEIAQALSMLMLAMQKAS